MKLQALLWAIGPIGALAIGAPLYLKHQVLVQPTWAETTTVSLADPKAVESARAIATAKLHAVTAPSRPIDRPSNASANPVTSPVASPETLTVNSQELTAIAASETDRLSQTYGIPGVARSISAHIADGKLEGGITVNLSALPPNSLSSQERSVLESALKAIPELGKQDIYIGVSGQPIVQDGQVEWGPNLRVHVGGLALSVEQIAQQVGINEADLRQELNQVLAQLKVSSLAIEGDKLHIQGQL
jgi:hypothetical protein